VKYNKKSTVGVYYRYFAAMDHVDDSLPLAVFGWVSAVTIHPFVIAASAY